MAFLCPVAPRSSPAARMLFSSRDELTRMPRPLTSRDLIVLAGSLAAIVVVTTTLPLLPAVSPMTVSLTFLLAVLGATGLGPLRVAILISIVALSPLTYVFLR